MKTERQPNERQWESNINDAEENGGTRWIATANHSFAPYAQEEFRRLFGQIKSVQLIPGETFLIELPASAEEVGARLKAEPPIFVRHIQPVDRFWKLEDGVEELKALRSFIAANEQRLSGKRAAVQIRRTEGTATSLAVAEAKAELEEALRAVSSEPVLRDADWVLSVFAATGMLYAGISRPEDNISDWSGGAIRFKREEGQISRAKFKLLEAERVFGLDLASCREGLDIGAAPGGWTSLLLERGLRVTAVDPAELHPSLIRHRNLTYLRKNASKVRFRPDQFDLLVCDMSWSPMQMVKLVSELLYSLRQGGIAIVTVKLMHKKPMQTIREVIVRFGEQRLQLQQAKQLFHNRDEITLYMIKY
ncbi:MULTISPECIES: SAM-dependent methyltransferase [unclassified Paenibacillus]|uniref:SAM-dependent methyltransferase n=1 Tax=unclassified Paenibacillus TaxID=185978 RepID=UPI001EF9C0D8|nr:SAM-dependent methyltransferase [Paenibacillus sp. MSJ-34]CAH0121165.1 Ribosomal RNA large subunit methyltransferase M [Paenibacillus sp. CECT 9249]